MSHRNDPFTYLRWIKSPQDRDIGRYLTIVDRYLSRQTKVIPGLGEAYRRGAYLQNKDTVRLGLQNSRQIGTEVSLGNRVPHLLLHRPPIVGKGVDKTTHHFVTKGIVTADGVDILTIRVLGYPLPKRMVRPTTGPTRRPNNIRNPRPLGQIISRRYLEKGRCPRLFDILRHCQPFIGKQGPKQHVHLSLLHHKPGL